MLILSANFGGLAALGIASLATSYGFNWRYAFLIGAVIAIVGVVARTRLREAPEFVTQARLGPLPKPSLGRGCKARSKAPF